MSCPRRWAASCWSVGCERSAPLLLSRGAGGETVEERLLAEGYSKRLIVLLKQLPEGLTVAGERVRSTRPLHPGEILAVALPLDPPRVHRLSVGVPVLYEDEDLTVYNKPAGMVCHRSGSHRYDTLENAAEGVFRAMNRLDKDTSGALVAAKHQLAAAKLWRNIERATLPSPTAGSQAAGEWIFRSAGRSPMSRSRLSFRVGFRQ